MGNSTEPMLSISLRPGISAVYILLMKGEVVYVGKTINIFCRISEHHRYMQRKRKGLQPYFHMKNRDSPVFDEVRAWHCARADLDKEEIALIQKYRPRYNTLMNREPLYDKLDLTQQPFFQNLLAKKVEPKPEVKRRKLPLRVQRIERQFQETRDHRMKITLPKLKFMEEDARA